MRQGRTVVLLMALLLGSAGCFPSEYLNHDQCHETLRIYTLPVAAPLPPHTPAIPGQLPALLPLPEMKEAWRSITLRECVLQAIQTGRLGEEAICVLTLNPPIARAVLEETARKSSQCEKCLPVTFGGSTEARVARVNYEKSKVELMLQVEELLLGVESAYWNLRFSYAVLQTREEALRLAEKLYDNAQAQYKERQLALPDLERLDEQRQLARAEYNQALTAGSARPGLQEAERQLRHAAGFLPCDGPKLVPVDEAAGLVPLPAWDPAVATALKCRNELVRARLEIEAAKVSAEACDPYERDRGQLQLEQKQKAFEQVKDQVLFQLQRALIQASQASEQLTVQEARYQAATRYLKAITEKGETARFADVRERLTAQRNQADAQRDRSLAQLDWQLALTQLERQLGTMLAHHKICFEDKLVSLGKTCHAKKDKQCGGN